MSGLAPPSLQDLELERLCLGHVATAAREAMAALVETTPAIAFEEKRSNPLSDGGDDDSSEANFSGAHGLQAMCK